MLNNVEYIVRARNKAELDKAVNFLYNCEEPEMAQLESRVDAPEMEVPTQPAIEEKPIAIQSTEKQTPPMKQPVKQPKTRTKAKPVDSKNVDLGRIGKGK